MDFSHQEYVMHKTLPWHDVIIISHDMLPSVYLSENKYISLHKAIYHMHVFSTPIQITLKQTHNPSRCDNQIAHSYHLGQPGEATIWLLPCLLIKMRYKCYAFSPYFIMISIFYNSALISKSESLIFYFGINPQYHHMFIQKHHFYVISYIQVPVGGHITWSTYYISCSVAPFTNMV